MVHKLDRLARNMEDHIAIRALLRKRGVTLISVTENLQETASGRLVEGIHALMAEFYSANLSGEIKKGMRQKAKQGGFPHTAPLGYLNTREIIAGRTVARIVPDPDRAPLITAAFDTYATGDWTLQTLADELAHRGLTNRRGTPPKPISWQGLAKILANPLYTGVVEWNGAQHPGSHQPLVSAETFRRVCELLAARSVRGTRERKHPHYLKGVLFCGVCGRRLSIQLSKGRYVYFYCLGQRTTPPAPAREPYVPAERIETELEHLYTRIQLPSAWLHRLREAMTTEALHREHRDAGQREFHARQLARAETQRRKLLDAYYGGAIDVPTLKREQDRIGADITTAQDELADLDANHAEWQRILDLAMQLATRCGQAYRHADDPTRRLFNQAIIETVQIKDGRIANTICRAPFDGLFGMGEFEYETLVELRGFEPLTPSMRTRCATGLRYSPRRETSGYHPSAVVLPADRRPGRR